MIANVPKIENDAVMIRTGPISPRGISAAPKGADLTREQQAGQGSQFIDMFLAIEAEGQFEQALSSDEPEDPAELQREALYPLINMNSPRPQPRLGSGSRLSTEQAPVQSARTEFVDEDGDVVEISGQPPHDDVDTAKFAAEYMQFAAARQLQPQLYREVKMREPVDDQQGGLNGKYGWLLYLAAGTALALLLLAVIF